MGRKKYRRTIKIKEFNTAQVITPIRKESGQMIDREATFKAIDKANQPKESPTKIPYLGGIKKTTLQDIGKEIQKKKEKTKEPKEVKDDKGIND